ncbi:MAG: SDR family oxidoreductase [Alphaproteobacteria bacterium]|nr:SDR family oxidoreductase [Alphaproteobacteria bacterium]
MASIKLRELFDLSGRVAIITGGSRGLGFQIAEALGEFGAHPVLVARRADELDAAVAALAGQGITASAIAADLGPTGAAVDLVARVLDDFGRIDILINNAAATWGARAEDYPDEAWDKVVNLGMTGAFKLSREVAKRAFIPAGRGVIVNVASIEGLAGHPASRLGTIAYNAAKGGVINMTRALAAEWGPKSIRVNAIAPGFFPSKMTAATVAAHMADLVERTPLGKLGGEGDLKGAALLLASDAGGHMTGHTLVVDGGYTVQ